MAALRAKVGELEAQQAPLKDQRRATFDTWFKQKPQEVAIGLDDGGPLPPQQPRLELADEAGQKRCEQHDERHLESLDEEGGDQVHSASTRSRKTSAKKTRPR